MLIVYYPLIVGYYPLIVGYYPLIGVLSVDDPLPSVTHGRPSSWCGHTYYYIDDNTKLELHEAHVPRAKMTDNINAHVAE